MAIGGGSAGVVITVRVERLEPLAGTAATEDGAERAFDGWMELIGAVAALIGSDRPGVGDLRAPTGPTDQGAAP
jgi:hypothetical protein